jgi:hypothetical protein
LQADLYAVSEDYLETQAEELKARLDGTSGDHGKDSALHQLHLVEQKLSRHRSSRRSNPQKKKAAVQVIIDNQPVSLRPKGVPRPRRKTFRRLPAVELEDTRTGALERLNRQSVVFNRKSSLYGFGFDTDGLGSEGSHVPPTLSTRLVATSLAAPTPPPLPRMSTIIPTHGTHGWEQR